MKLMRNNTKLLASFILGLIVASSVGVSIAYNINAGNIMYQKVNGDDTNVENALTELYNLSKIHCPEGDTCIKLSTDTVESPNNNETFLAIVYLNPVGSTYAMCAKNQYEADLEAYKAANDTNTPTGQKSGCMKWYVYSATGTTYDLILDHNTTANNINWNDAQNIFSSYSWDNNLNVRNISANEIAKITKADIIMDWDVNKPYSSNGTDLKMGTNIYGYWMDCPSFAGNYCDQFVFGKGKSKYYWLYDYTSNCENFGCNIQENNSEILGYWTSDLQVDDFSHAWRIGALGDFHLNNINSLDGVRPVITIQK